MEVTLNASVPVRSVPRTHYVLRLHLSGPQTHHTMLDMDDEEWPLFYTDDQWDTLTAGQPLLMDGVVHVEAEAFISARLFEGLLAATAMPAETGAPHPAPAHGDWPNEPYGDRL